jgi:hypothetical protein
MERRDYLQKQIDELGKVLGKILSNLLGLKNQGEMNEGIEITNQALKTELELDIESLLAIPTDEFVKMLQSKKEFSNESLDKLADIFLLMADHHIDNQEIEKAKTIYEKCLAMYEFLEKTESIYSFERHFKIGRIKNILG